MIPRLCPSGALRPADCSSWTEVCMPESAIGKTLGSRILRTPAAQVLRLEFSNEQLGRRPGFQSGRAQQRRKVLSGDRHARDGAFRSELAQQKITPVDVLMAGFWNLGTSGVSVAQKTVIADSVGAQGTWTTSMLVPTGPGTSGEVRSFASYTDSVTGEEMAFAGANSPMAPSPASSRAGSTRPATPSCGAQARRRGPSA